MAPGQRRLWLLSKLHPESAAYNVVVALRLRGPLVVDALRVALSDVVDRHDALRVRVVEEPGAEPRLRYSAQAHPELVIKETGQPLSEEFVAGFVHAVSAEPISIDAGPLLRAVLLRGEDPGLADACLVIVVHHMVSDQRSADLILRDLATAYAARLGGQQAAFPPAPSFGDYADAEAGRRGDSHWAEDLAYWRDVLGCSPGNARLPFPIRSGAPPSLQGSDHNLRLTPEEGDRIDSYARANGITPAVLVLGCAAVVLCGWLGSERVIIGMPASRRRTTQQQDLVGFLVDTLPIVADVGRNPDLNSLLRHLRDQYVAALSHSAPSFDAIVEALELPPRLMGSPLFQVWFNDLTQGSAAPPIRTLEVTALPTSGWAALFDLNLYLHREQHGYRLQLVRAVDRVREVVAEELLQQCRVVLAQILSDDTANPVNLPLMTPRAAAVWEQGASLPGPEQVTALATAPPEPGAPALVTPFGELTHAELGRLVEKLSGELTRGGVMPGTVVEIHAHRAGGLPLALLACWRLGAVAGLVDASLPAASRARSRRLLQPAQILIVDADAPARVTIERGSVPPQSLPGVSHVLFTSGSGGQQLAILGPEDSVEAALAWYSASFAPGPGDRIALLGGLGHDPVLRDMLVPLRFGGTLVIPSPDVFSDPGALLDLLSERQITILHATPPLLELILAAQAANPETYLSALRLVISAGAPLTVDQVRRLQALTAAAVVNGYGTTETPQLSACHHITGYGESPGEHLADHSGEAILPIGQGVAGAGLLVHTRSGEPTGTGQVGEILVRGRRLALGYLGSEEMNDRFIPDPCGVPGVRAFRTGDLGRLGPDGLVYFCGRIDRQLSIDGFRVEPAEIEAAARRIPEVVQAAAGMADTAAGPLLALQVVAAPGTILSTADVRAHLRTQLAAHAIPGSITVVPKLAINANHKIVLNQQIMPAAGQAGTKARHPDRGAGVAGGPGDEMLGWLVGLFREVAGSDITPEQNFFEAGLTSMTMLRLHAHIACVLPDPPPATALFAYPTLRALARFLAGQTEDARPRRRRPLEADSVGHDAQQRRARRRQPRPGPAVGPGQVG